MKNCCLNYSWAWTKGKSTFIGKGLLYIYLCSCSDKLWINITELWLAHHLKAISVFCLNAIISISVLNFSALFNMTVTIDGIFLAARSAQFNFYFIPTNSSCMVLGLCSFQLDLNECSLYYGTDPAFSDLSLPIHGPINYPFILPPLKEFTTYYYTVSVLVESSLHVTTHGIYVTEDCDINSSTLGNDKVRDLLIYSSNGLRLYCCDYFRKNGMNMSHSLPFLAHW